MNKVSKHLQWLIFVTALAGVFVLSGCGSKQSPTGGKADTEKLRVLATMPEQFAEINEQQVEITFDKSVDRTTFLTGYYIYPPVQNKKIYYESNVITIRFLEALNPNTNYYLTLTTRIKDSRGNPLEKNETLIYRHGILQTNRISGNITYEKPEDNGLPVLINLVSSDSLWVLTKNVTGTSYVLDSLNPLEYILRAYIDKNLNGRYDTGTEPYQETEIPLQAVNSINLAMAYADTVKPVIKSVQAVSNREYEIVLNKPVLRFNSVTIEDMTTKSNIRIFTINHALNKINVLTALTDSTKLAFKVTGLQDNKENKTKLSELTIPASTKPDLTPPSVVAVSPRNGSTVNDLQPLLEVTFSEVIPVGNFHASLFEVESVKNVALRIIHSNDRKYQLKPDKALENYKTCQLIIGDDTSDLSGNNLKQPYKLTFLPVTRTTPANPGK